MLNLSIDVTQIFKNPHEATWQSTKRTTARIIYYIICELQTIPPKPDFSLRTLQTNRSEGTVFSRSSSYTWKVKKILRSPNLSSEHRVCSAYFSGDHPVQTQIQNIRHKKPDLDDQIRTLSVVPASLSFYAT